MEKSNMKSNTRYEAVADRIVSLIQNGVLKEGDRVPSLRQLSRELNVSVNTVKEAYWKLENRDYLTAVPQSGFYVKQQLPATAAPEIMDPRMLDPRAVSLCQVYGSYMSAGQSNPGISLGIAALNPQFWPTEKMGRYFQDALRHQEFASYNYLMAPGYAPLQEQIARRSLACGLTISPDEIIVTNGCHEAVFIALMSVCRPGDTVALESPIYFNLLNLLQQLNLRIIEIPGTDGDGIHLNTLRFVLENHPVKAVFSISNCNNPLGFSIPEAKKEALVELLSDFDIPLIEDDIYGDIAFGDRHNVCKAYDKSSNTILCSSFSKTIAPGLRIGWIVPGKHYDTALKLKTLLNIATSSVNQIATAKFLKEGGYDRHLRKLKKTLQEQTMRMRASILSHFPQGTTVTDPSGGFLLWVCLPENIDTDAFYQKALGEDILFAPGCLFSVKGKYNNCLRLNAGIWNAEVERKIATLGALFRGKCQ